MQKQRYRDRKDRSAEKQHALEGQLVG